MKYTPDQLDRFADLLAEEVLPSDAARRLGLGPIHGLPMLNLIRKKLGPQAK